MLREKYCEKHIVSSELFVTIGGRFTDGVNYSQQVRDYVQKNGGLRLRGEVLSRSFVKVRDLFGMTVTG